eukprot:gene2368-32901_t
MSTDWQWREAEDRKDRLELLVTSLGWRKDRLDGHCVDTEPGRTGYADELSFVALLDRYKAQDGYVQHNSFGIESGGEKYAYPRREAVNSKLNISVMEGSKRTAATAATLAAVAESYRPRYYAFDILSRHTKQLEMVYNRTAKLNNSVADRPASSRQYGETLNLAISQLERKIARTLIQLGKQQEKVLARHRFRALEVETVRYKNLRRTTSRFIKNGCTNEEQQPANATTLGLNIPFSFIC